MDERVKTMKKVIAERIKPEVIREENEALKAELKEVESRCEYYEKKLYENELKEKINYMRGRIDGLEFAIRCNGVSGDSVKHA